MQVLVEIVFTGCCYTVKQIYIVFFRSIVHALHGQTDMVAVENLRHEMYGLLLNIAGQNNIYPRNNPNFEGRDEFLRHLQFLILGAEEGGVLPQFEHEHHESLHFYAVHMQPMAHGEHERWGQVDDAILASMLLRRPIVIVRPPMHVVDPSSRWNDASIHQQLHIFFPDGSTRVFEFLAFSYMLNLRCLLVMRLALNMPIL